MSNSIVEATASTPFSTSTSTSRPGAGSSVRTQPTPSWMPWAGSVRLCTTAEEDRFSSQLAENSGSVVREVRRRDITAVMNALRCGLDLTGLLERAPGLDPARLNEAYRYLDALRTGAVLAWTDIVVDPTPEVFVRRAATARLLLPRPVSILQQILDEEPSEFGNVVDHLKEAIGLADDAAAAVEVRIESTPNDGMRLGRLLYDADGTGIANWPTYLPRRVGMLSPTRVASLLGERTERSQFESVRATSGG